MHETPPVGEHKTVRNVIYDSTWTYYVQVLLMEQKDMLALIYIFQMKRSFQ